MKLVKLYFKYNSVHVVYLNTLIKILIYTFNIIFINYFKVYDFLIKMLISKKFKKVKSSKKCHSLLKIKKKINLLRELSDKNNNQQN